MPTHVYANNNEVASKAADGKSIAAFPDVCFSPPAPPVGPMPLPYPNTGEVKDTDSGTAKVFVKDKMSGMAGDSHMTKSMGDDAATQNFNKGMITGALQGKCYFGLWSMDVQMEGKGVPRHLDMVTHNHGSNPCQCINCDCDKNTTPQNIDNKNPRDNKKIKIVSVDLFRQNRGNNTIKYVGTSIVEDEVYTSLKDTESATDAHLVQYVNLAPEKLTREITLPHVQKYTSNSNSQLIPSLSQVGKDISIRIRFNSKGEHSFKLSISKKGARYSKNEISANQSKHAEILCHMDNIPVKFNKWITFTTNDDGYIAIDVKLDMSHAIYKFSAKYGGVTKELELESWRKIFIRSFVLDSFSTNDILSINDSIGKTIKFYCQYGIDIEHLCQINYQERDIYMERVIKNGKFQYGMMLNGKTNQACTSFFQSINTILNRESTNNMHNTYSIDIFFIYYLYMSSLNVARFKTARLNSGGKFVLTLNEGHFINPKITSASPITEVLLIVNNDIYTFKFSKNQFVAAEEMDYSLILEYNILDDTKVELIPGMSLLNKIGNNITIHFWYFNVTTAGGYSFFKPWRPVFATLYPTAIENHSHTTSPNLNRPTQWLPSIIAHEIAHRIDLVPENKNSNVGTIVLEKSSTSNISSHGHCVNSSCLMYHEIEEAQGRSNNMKPVCSSCEHDINRADLRLDLPLNLII